MSKSEMIIKKIDWIQKILIALFAVFCYVTIYDFQLVRAIIIDTVVIIAFIYFNKDMRVKLEELEKV